MTRGRLLTRRSALRGGLAAGVATVGVLSGCAPQRVPEGRNAARLWFTYGGKNRQILEELVGLFNAREKEHFIVATFQGDYFEGLAKLRTAMAARAVPTLSHVVGEVVPYLAEAGVLEGLERFEGARALDVLPALGQSGTWVGGSERPLVALPFNRSTPIAFCNGAIFDREGVKPPTTWQELFAAARWLTVRAGDRVERYGFACPIDWWFWAALVGQAGGDIVDERGVVTLGGAAGVKALELWQRLVNEERAMKPPPGRDYNAWEAVNQDFLAGRVAMIWTSTAFVRYLEGAAKFPVRAAPLPGFVRRAVPTGGTHWVMPKGAPAHEQRAAWAFLRFMHEVPQAIRWATSTGYIPTTRGAITELERSGYYQKSPNDRVALDQLEVARPWPWSPELFRVQRELVQPRLEAAVLGRASASASLAEARALAARPG